MKKILLIVLTIITIISVIAITASAKAIHPQDVSKYLKFEQTKKVYPIAKDYENVVPFCEYYGMNNINYQLKLTRYITDGTRLDLSVHWHNSYVTSSARIDGYEPTFTYELINENQRSFSDFGIAYDGENLVVVGLTPNGNIIYNPDLNQDFYDSNGFYYFEELLSNDLSDGYYVDYNLTSYEIIEKPLIENILEGLKEFISGFGNAFSKAFTSVFMKDGRLNVLSYVLLSFFGLALGYGVIRYITGLFRKET